MIARLAEWFAMVSVRHRVIVLAVTGMLVVAAIYPATRVPFDASAEIWFLETDPALRAYQEFHDLFGNDEFVLLATEVEEGTVFRNDVLASVARVTGMLEITPHTGRVVSLTRYETIRGDGDDLTLVPAVPHLPLPPEELAAAEARVLADELAVGRVVTAAGRVAVIVAEVIHRPGSFDHKAELTDAVTALLDRERAEHGIEYVFTGSAVLDTDVYRDTRHDLRWNVPLLYVFIALLLALTIRNVAGVVLPLAVVLSTVTLDRALIPLLGWNENSLATIIPLVLTAVGVADSVHIVVQYFALRGRGLPGPEAASETVRRMFKPCLLTSVTTGIGFLSLLTAPLAPLQQMGALTAAGVTMAFLLSVLTLPAALSYLKGDYREYAERREGGALMRLVDALPYFVRRYRTAILVGAVLVSVAAAFGIARLKVESNAIHFFRPHDPLRVVTEYVQEHVGGVGNLEMIVISDRPAGIRDPEVLRAMDGAARWLRAEPLITDAYSVVDYLKAINRAMHGGDPEYHRLPDNPDLVAQYLLLYGASSPEQDLGNLVDLSETRARVGARVKFASSREYKERVAALREHVIATFPAGVDVRFTGLMMLYKNMGDYIIKSQIRSFLAALIVITLTMTVAFRSWRVGLLSMIPNVWPIVFTLGLMGWLGVRLDMINAMVAAVAIGIAVDDTVHFLSKYVEAVDRGQSLVRSVSYAFHVSGRAIVFTSLILFAGFGIIVRSAFLPSVVFALLCVVCVAMALVADLLILPAIFLRYRPVYRERRGRNLRRPLGAATLGLVLALPVPLLLAGSAAAAPPAPLEVSEPAGAAASPEAPEGADTRGRDVMQAVEDASRTSRSETADIVMVLRDRSGNEVTRRARLAYLNGEDDAEGDRSLIRFSDPPDLRGTAFLTHEHAGDDDQWLFLPALGRVKRIAASRRTGSFVGTEFTYEDLGGRELDAYRYRYLRADEVEGEAVDVVEAIPLAEHTGYSRVVSWVSAERQVILRVEYFDRKGAPLKASRSTGYTRTDGDGWRFGSAVMENLQTGKSTEIRVEQWTLDADLDPALFSVEALAREW